MKKKATQRDLNERHFFSQFMPKCFEGFILRKSNHFKTVVTVLLGICIVCTELATLICESEVWLVLRQLCAFCSN